MTRLHISENCKQLKIMSITINICIDNALFYLFHITPEQSWSHMETVFLQVQNLVYSTFYINPNSKILPIKSFIFVNLKFHYCLGREKSSSLQQQKRGGEKRRYGNRCQGLSAGFCSISLRNSVCILGI